MKESLEKIAVQQNGVKWLAEMELLENPQLLNTLKLNILMISKGIKDVEILSLYLYGKKDMLIWLDLKWWGYFKERKLKEEAETVISTILPEFNIRVITNYEIMRLAVKKLKVHFEKPMKVELK